jgi:hypothetical protein
MDLFVHIVEMRRCLLDRSLFAWLIALACLFLAARVRSDNPTAIVKPYAGPDPGYILAESDGGLSNRLRVLLRICTLLKRNLMVLI